MIFGVCLLIVWFTLVYVLDVAQADNNKYLDRIYFIVYLSLLVPYFIGLVLILTYGFLRNEDIVKSFPVWFFILSFLSALSIIVWQLIYFLSINEYDEVYTLNITLNRFNLSDDKVSYTR